jgi:uncharacterized protein
MAYKTNHFCWHGVVSTDPEKAGAFYSEVLGWKVEKMPMGDDVATMFSAGGVPLAHYMAPPMPGIPSHWDNYLRVDSVDEAAKTAVENGGAILVPGTDIPVGRFAVVTSPSGAAISLFHEGDEAASEHHPGGLGSIHWTELHSTDIAADMTWLKATFGFEISEMPMPNGTYYLLNSGGEMCGGAMQGFMPGAPSMWMSWVQVDDCDAALARVTQFGGKALGEPMDMEGVGRMAAVMDSTGGVFGIIKPAAKG